MWGGGDVWSEGGGCLVEEGGSRRQTPSLPEMATAAVSTHPTGMHSCFNRYPLCIKLNFFPI